ncbi:MAG: YdcF family protein [Alphaproteobacteria bacterium]|nr:YdcF family protein [Alphaproteobacteria bacterium]
MRRTKFIALMYLECLFLLWFGGFVIFQQYIRKRPIDNTTKTDAIVVLTGGKNRIVEAVKLYNNGLADMLFISGVEPHVSFKSLEVQNKVQIKRQRDHVFLGKEATNTIENAVEVGEIIRRNNLKSIRLVTSYYHMPRSLNELKALNPDVEVIEHPVYSKNVSKRWWKRPKSFYLIASEYHKFIYVYLKNFISGLI